MGKGSSVSSRAAAAKLDIGKEDVRQLKRQKETKADTDSYC